MEQEAWSDGLSFVCYDLFTAHKMTVYKALSFSELPRNIKFYRAKQKSEKQKDSKKYVCVYTKN